MKSNYYKTTFWSSADNTYNTASLWTVVYKLEFEAIVSSQKKRDEGSH